MYIRMSNNSIKQELYDVLSGKIKIRNGEPLQTIACYLRSSKETSLVAKNTKQFKREETQRLKSFAVNYGLWIKQIDFENYVSEGAEQRVYLRDSKHVMKLNDSIYYESWIDYIYNLILHNYFFEDVVLAHSLLCNIRRRHQLLKKNHNIFRLQSKKTIIFFDLKR